MRLGFVALSSTLLFVTAAQARTVDPGTFWLSGGLGGAFKEGSNLGGSNGYLMLTVQGEYVVSSNWGVVGDVTLGNLGLWGTNPLRVHAGARYRLTGLQLPVSPYAQLQFSAGKLFNALGANLWTFGPRVALGADYFLTAKLLVGAAVGYELLVTTGPWPSRSVSYNQIDFMALVGYSF
jgi:hypothetical protein